MLLIRDSPRFSRHTWTENEKIEKHMPWSGNGKKAEVAILISNKIDLRTNTIIRQRRTLHNDKGFNPRRYNNYNYI